MPGPRKKYRQRPKKVGAKKKQRIKAQRKRLLAAGLEEEYVDKLTDAQVREKLKKISKKKSA